MPVRKETSKHDHGWENTPFDIFQSQEYIMRMIYKNTGYEYEKLGLITQRSSWRQIIRFIISKIIKRNKLPIEQGSHLRLKKNNTICFLSPYYENGTDGYFQRVKAIDSQVFKDWRRVYLDCYKIDDNSFSFKEIDKNHIQIKFNSFNEEHINHLKSMLGENAVFYIHSINQIMPDVIGINFINYVFSSDHLKILDVHGAVPSEIEMSGNKGRSSLASIVEKIYFNKADALISVSEEMTNYIKQRLSQRKNIYKIPVFANLPSTKEEKKYNTKPKVIYSGGLQQWQNFEEMLNFIELHKKEADYEFYLTQEPSKDLQERMTGLNVKWEINNREKMFSAYSSADYGLIFRKYSIVNKLACPTKLIEYISNGIVPIAEYTNLGDFTDKTVSYINKEEVKSLNLPVKERREMASRNKKTLADIEEQKQQGIKSLLEYIAKERS